MMHISRISLATVTKGVVQGMYQCPHTPKYLWGIFFWAC